MKMLGSENASNRPILYSPMRNNFQNCLRNSHEPQKWREFSWLFAGGQACNGSVSSIDIRRTLNQINHESKLCRSTQSCKKQHSTIYILKCTLIITLIASDYYVTNLKITRNLILSA